MDYVEIGIAQVVWDEINKQHIWEKHRINQDQVEQAIYDNHRLARILPNGRIILLGITKKKKVIWVIISPKDAKRTIWYPVTARRANKKEVNLYKQGDIIK